MLSVFAWPLSTWLKSSVILLNAFSHGCISAVFTLLVSSPFCVAAVFLLSYVPSIICVTIVSTSSSEPDESSCSCLLLMRVFPESMSILISGETSPMALIAFATWASREIVLVDTLSCSARRETAHGTFDSGVIINSR